MKIYSLIHKALICVALVCTMLATGCKAIFAEQATPIVARTSTPEKLELTNGELDSCQLISPTEAESVLGMEVVSKERFGESSLWCIYSSTTDERVFFETIVTTNATIKRGNQPFNQKYNSTQFFTAGELYQQTKESYTRKSEIFKTEDIKNFGDQAFLITSSFFVIHILNNDIYYRFDTQVNGGIGYDALMKLAQIALQRMP